MAATNYTPISLYYSSTAAATPVAGNLVNGELAINITDGKLYYKDNAGVVQVIADKTGTGVKTISFGTTGLTPSTATNGAVTVAGTLITSNGGTGLSSYTAGDLMYYASGTALSKLAIGTANYVLTSSGTAPQWVAASSITVGAAGSNTQVQYNNSGVLGASSNFTFDGTNIGLAGGTANGVAYLNGSKVLTTGSALTFDGTNLGVGTASPVSNSGYAGATFNAVNGGLLQFQNNGTNKLRLFCSGTQSVIDTGAGVLKLLPADTLTLGTQSTDIIFQNGAAGELMRLTSTGLGIGTSSPASKLQVTSANGAVTLDSGTGESHYIDINHKGSYSSVNGIRFKQNSTTYGNNQIDFLAMDSGGTVQTVMTLNGSGNLGLGVTPSAWYSGKKAIQVGAQSALSAESSATLLSLNFYADGGNVARYIGSGYASLYNQYSGQHAWYTAPSGTAGNAISFTQAMTLDAGGNLGIGTSAPSSKVDIAWSNNAGIRLSDGTVTGVIYNTSGNSMGIGTVTNHPTVFYTNNAEKMRIDSSGNVGIGTSSPAQKLDVTGNAAVSGQIMAGTTTAYSDGAIGTPRLQWLAKAGTYAGAISIADTASNLDHWVLRNTNGNIGSIGTNGTSLIFSNPPGSERMRIDSSGRVDIGGAAGYGGLNISKTGLLTPGVYLWINATATNQKFASFEFNGNGGSGSITPNGSSAVSYNTSSDYRLKENIQPMQNALDVVAQLNPVTYTWKADGSDGQGFIAHELQAVVPDCVTGEKDAVDEEGNPVYQGIDTSFLVATLTKAIQELKAELDATKAEVASLKGN